MKFRKIITILLINALISTPSLIPKAYSVEDGATQSAQYLSSLKNTNAYVKLKDSYSAPIINAKSYFLIDSNSAKVLISKNDTVKYPIASTTKMMTAIVARKLFKLDDVVTITEKSTNISGSSMELVKDEQITVENLLNGLLIKSGNDAAYALAYHYSNDLNYTDFVLQMNNEAKELGLINTQYGDPAGLDDENGYSTAYDLSMIARKLLSDPELAKIVATANKTVNSLDNKVSHQLKNTNRFLHADSPYFNKAVFGVKTGFTFKAGHCLVAAFNIKDRPFVAVILSTSEYSFTASATEMRKLIRWADTNIDILNY